MTIDNEPSEPVISLRELAFLYQSRVPYEHVLKGVRATGCATFGSIRIPCRKVNGRWVATRSDALSGVTDWPWELERQPASAGITGPDWNPMSRNRANNPRGEWYRSLAQRHNRDQLQALTMGLSGSARLYIGDDLAGVLRRSSKGTTLPVGCYYVLNGASDVPVGIVVDVQSASSLSRPAQSRWKKCRRCRHSFVPTAGGIPPSNDGACTHPPVRNIWGNAVPPKTEWFECNHCRAIVGRYGEICTHPADGLTDWPQDSSLIVTAPDGSCESADIFRGDSGRWVEFGLRSDGALGWTGAYPSAAYAVGDLTGLQPYEFRDALPGYFPDAA